MVSAMRSKVFVLLFLCFCINLTLADGHQIKLHGRDGQQSTTATGGSIAPSSTGEANGGKNGEETPTGSANSTITSTSTSVSATHTEASITAITSNINGPAPTSILTFSGFNSTLTPNALPLQPEITAGLAVAGVLLILSGVIYTLIGIKNRWLHISLSAAYLGSLGVTVLILYVMNPPVSSAIQGAYVVAIVMTGLILGGASIVFTEMTEGLGCLLGGFCFSMWLLVLKPGGLLTTTSGKAIFIAAFTLAAFSTSFTHYTRPYGLLIFVPFGGATAVVLGIDCFSRAGLKEFWAYLWNLNSNLFPLGATSYPLTRGIRVEIAATVIIFLAGILSQSKLWKHIQQRREQRAAERLQHERDLEQQEHAVGMRIEDANAVDRNQWEAVYGDNGVANAPRDSGVGDMDSQKKGPTSEVTSIRNSGGEEIEMSQMSSPTLVNTSGLVMTSHGQEGGPVTVRVARDMAPPPELDEFGIPVQRLAKRDSQMTSQDTPAEEENVWVVGADGEARLERRPSKRNSNRLSGTNIQVTKAPDVVALPFKVPEGEIDDDRSSVATFADEEQAGRKRLSTRLSQVLMRKLSQRSNRTSKRYSMGEEQSTEDLVIPREIEEDRRSSIAATMDGLSDDEDMRSIRSSMNQKPDTTESARVPGESNILEGESMQPETRATAKHPVSPVIADHKEVSGPVSTAVSDPKPIVEGAKVEVPTQKSLTTSTDPRADPERAKERVSADKTENPAPSIVSQGDSKPSSLSKDRLPPQLSRVVMSYRTNEWAKHLSNADAPDLDELKLEEYPIEKLDTVEEVAAPVNIEDLQQTAENARPPSAPRTTSQMSSQPPLTRSNTAQSKYPTQADENISSFHHRDILSWSSSQQSLPTQLSQPQTLNRTLGYRSSSTPVIPQQIVESPIEENFPSVSPKLSSNKFAPNVPYGQTNTLMSKRDTLLRGKNSYYSNPSALSSTPEFSSHQHPVQYNSSPASGPGSDAGSIYAQSPVIDDDNMSLSARRDLIRQSSLNIVSSSPPLAHQNNFDSHQPRRQSTLPPPVVREQQLASWRASVQQDLLSGIAPKKTIERQRSALWQERQAEEQKKVMDERMRERKDSAFDERMRRGDMLDAHREALRKMQGVANKHASIAAQR